MLLDKDFVMQGGVRNYLGKTEEVKAPKYWKSSKDSPSTELVYITEAEKGLLADANLHGSLKNGKPLLILNSETWNITTKNAKTNLSDVRFGIWLIDVIWFKLQVNIVSKKYLWLVISFNLSSILLNLLII